MKPNIKFLKIPKQRMPKMTSIKTQVRAVFHFIDGDEHEVVLSVKSGKHEEIMTSITDQVGKFNVLAFIDKEFY